MHRKEPVPLLLKKPQKKMKALKKSRFVSLQ